MSRLRGACLVNGYLTVSFGGAIMSTPIKKCPFCNGGGKLAVSTEQDINGNLDWFVFCVECGAQGPHSWKGASQAFDDWGMRVEL
jgi:Zn ribbon nucleic-acid-binding protein